MWQEIIDHLSRLYGEKMPTPQTRLVGGGSINQTYKLQLGGYVFFVKLNAASKMSMLEAEAEALQEIARTQKIRVPTPIAWGTSQNYAYLVLEWIDLQGAKDWRALAENLAALHRVQAKQYGWHRSNTIGETPQINTWTGNWADFFWQHRILYQLKLADRKGFRSPVSWDKLQSRVYELLANHRTFPSLVHGDLWGGNYGFDPDGEPVIFDPAAYYGDREVDIAMTELFGGFAPEFYNYYQQAFPLEPGYQQRKTLYNLYHILNHFNLFGGSYQYQAQQMISRICQ
ncbi:MAG: fructosamine kinase family protein [Pseudanabaenaceae cyanobacterium SKYGB_i_bin29]|nr:fructosamine kinase family protein [Pseudanabaenaceae cyanobacterium SKYG29]MDW8421150.1 fructosamine kinase family protein [Pseudanabaenaceae cyanobacterium SKYGB_i_bin29]